MCMFEKETKRRNIFEIPLLNFKFGNKDQKRVIIEIGPIHLFIT